PVITQETGFSNLLPIGEGLFGFLTLEDILEAVDRINADYRRHCRAAYEIAREYFSHDVVLFRLLSDCGLPVSLRARSRGQPRAAGDLAIAAVAAPESEQRGQEA